MKTGIVCEIENNKAVVMLNGGSFVSVNAKSGWKRGDLVPVESQPFSTIVSSKAFYAAAACFICIVLLGFGGNKLYYTPTSLISIDINPSIELTLNRFDRVIGVRYFNNEGKDVLSSIKLIHRKYEQAIDVLMASSALTPYLAAEEVLITFTVQSDNPGRDNAILDMLNHEVESLSRQHSALHGNCEVISRELVNEAHAKGVSPGKYGALLKLKESKPDINIDNYREMSLREIMKITRQPVIENNTESNAVDGQVRMFQRRSGSVSTPDPVPEPVPANIGEAGAADILSNEATPGSQFGEASTDDQSSPDNPINLTIPGTASDQAGTNAPGNTGDPGNTSGQAGTGTQGIAGNQGNSGNLGNKGSAGSGASSGSGSSRGGSSGSSGAGSSGSKGGRR